MQPLHHLLRLIAVPLLLVTSIYSMSAQGRSIPKGSEAKAQEQVQQISDILPDGQKYRYPLLNGVNLSVDIFDPILYATAFDHASFEVQAMADLHHRFFPMAAFGMGLCNETSNNGLEFGTGQKQECRFKSGLSPFGKVGMAYNLKYNDLRPNDCYMLLARYGMAYSTADITNLYCASQGFPPGFGPIDITDQKYFTHWLEVGGMMKVQISGHFSLGWDLYWKIKLAQTGTKSGVPYYVPGFGTTDSSIGFSFRVFYELF